MSLPVVDEILRWKKVLLTPESPDDDVLAVLTFLQDIDVTRELLAKTKIGVVVSKLRHAPNTTISSKAKKLVDAWKSAVIPKSRLTNGLQAKSSESVGGDTDAGTCDTSTHVAATTTPTSSPPAVATAPYPGPFIHDPKRNKVREILFRALIDGMPEDQLSEVNAEQAGSVTAAIEEALWDHHMTSQRNNREYQAQLRSIKSNLADKKNPEFNIRILVQAITPAELAVMPSVDMASDARKRERQKAKKDALEACQSDWDLRNIKRAAGQFPCGKCKSSNTSYFQMQTRSSDEPMTTFVNCLDCGNRWKF